MHVSLAGRGIYGVVTGGEAWVEACRGNRANFYAWNYKNMTQHAWNMREIIKRINVQYFELNNSENA